MVKKVFKRPMVKRIEKIALLQIAILAGFVFIT